ncbi:MAG: fibronectin type III-like domain-contianing protein, partial [Acidobacteriota bacterium]
KELKDFARVTLQPGESKVLHFALDREKLESVGMDMKRVVQPGDFEIMVGGNSADLLKTRLTVRGM